MSSAITQFYSGAQPDDRGRYLNDIQKWTDDELERVHDFIQWMFPLRERSGVNYTAPVLDEATIREFKSRPELQDKLRSSFLRMVKFYGMEIAGPVPQMKIEPGPNF